MLYDIFVWKIKQNLREIYTSIGLLPTRRVLAEKLNGLSTPESKGDHYRFC